MGRLTPAGLADSAAYRVPHHPRRRVFDGGGFIFEGSCMFYFDHDSLDETDHMDGLDVAATALDAERYVTGEYETGHWKVIDTETNGTFDVALGKGHVRLDVKTSTSAPQVRRFHQALNEQVPDDRPFSIDRRAIDMLTNERDDWPGDEPNERESNR